MTRNIRRATALVLGLALSAVSASANAQDDLMPEDAAQVDVMQDDSSVVADYGKGYGGKGCGDDCCSSGSAYAEFQYVRLSQHETEGNFDNTDENDGYRAIVGYAGCDGLGARLRYFDFEGVEPVGTVGNFGLDTYYFDAEVTQAFCLCGLEGVVSGGYRHADILAVAQGTLTDFEGDGLTFDLTLERQISCSLGLYGSLRYSMLYGEDDIGAVDNDVVNWTEGQLGAQYSTCVGGYDAFVRGGVEAHHIEASADTQNIGLVGWFLSAGVGF